MSRSEFKRLFLNTKHPDEITALAQRYPGMRLDADMARHFNAVARRFSDGETAENHTDPREAFIRKDGGD